ncbi:LytR/AlgR family response regulator transcription factor [Anaerorudis cellulosivorans]|uniref:LytR/AlgR family response regulator transcription factor n=1 Tax=Anaerorudis cellulosivorans TaxID=3397862 RepID=UPI00221F5110|nr:LytTR family DNA-binding domain-containing protein [Seramator thermalis]MCW1734207.1 LytTR family DNA-binding domain-containing protein [Seramator thermalis]
MILSCWIIDDEPLALDLLESYVQKTPFLKLTGKYSSALTAMHDLENQAVDVIFLDIQMPELDGLEFSQLINPQTRIIFTTAFSEYAVEGYKVNALDYLLKPISYADFLASAKKALNWFDMAKKAAQSEEKEKERTGLFVKSEYKLVQVLFDDILYIEGLKDYIKIYVKNETRPIITLMSLKNMEDTLPSDRFLRVHRSYIVQKNKIENINKNRITIAGHEISIGETYRQNLMDEIGKG